MQTFILIKKILFLIIVGVVLKIFILNFNKRNNNDEKKVKEFDDDSKIPYMIVVGPGIQQATLPMPYRYFFIFHRENLCSIRIHSKDDQNNNNNKCRILTQVLNETQFCVNLSRRQLFKAKDLDSLENILQSSAICDDEQLTFVLEHYVHYKLTIVRYTLHFQSECFDNLVLTIHSENGFYSKTLFESYLPNGPAFYSENCDCPLNMEEFTKQMKCYSRSNIQLQEQINEDLRTFKTSDGLSTISNFSEILEDVRQRFGKHPKTYALCHYKIVRNQAFKECFGEYVGFSKFFDRMLLSLLRKTRMLDNEFLINLGDWPLSVVNSGGKLGALPIFSWCGSIDADDIVLPTYEITESFLRTQSHVHPSDILSIFGKQKLPFFQKQNRLFWRGRDSNRARLSLMNHSLAQPNLYDVAITNFFFFRDEMHKYQINNENSTNVYVRFVDFFKYRYQINIDGTVAAYRFPFLMAGNSLILKQRSKYYEFFYRHLIDEWHYLPVNENLNDLPEKLNYLMEKKEFIHMERLHKMKNMIWQSRRDVLRYLLPSNIYCYYFQALQSYRQLLSIDQDDRARIEYVKKFMQPVIDDDSELVPFKLPKCSCNEANSKLTIKTEL